MSHNNVYFSCHLWFAKVELQNYKRRISWSIFLFLHIPEEHNHCKACHNENDEYSKKNKVVYFINGHFTYYVPTIRLVFASCSSFPKILANPKSDILGIISLSSKMLLAFRSRWTIIKFEYSWRYRRPWVTPSMMSTRFLQSKREHLGGSAASQMSTLLVIKKCGGMKFTNNDPSLNLIV